MPEVAVAWRPAMPWMPPAWVVLCTRCGVLPVAWVHQASAAWDAMGHAAAHHSR